MSLNRSGYAVSRCWGLLGVFLSAVLALPLFDPAVATAQDTRQSNSPRSICRASSPYSRI